MPRNRSHPPKNECAAWALRVRPGRGFHRNSALRTHSTPAAHTRCPQRARLEKRMCGEAAERDLTAHSVKSGLARDDELFELRACNVVGQLLRRALHEV